MKFNVQQFLDLSVDCMYVFLVSQSSDSALYSVEGLVFITEMESVNCAVRLGSFNKRDYISSMKS